MCGIIGYIGKKQALPFLIDGLKKLEYRGYDSAGFCVKNGDDFKTVKNKGKVGDLEKRIENSLILGNVGIAHCLHPDTVILTNTGGTIYIKDIVNGTKVINLDVKKYCLSNNKVKVLKHKLLGNLYRVRTPISDFKATPDHKTLVFRKYGKNKWLLEEKKVSNLKKGDYLPLPKKINISLPQKLSFKNIFCKRYYNLTDQGASYWRQKINEFGKKEFVKSANISSSYLEHIKANDRNIREDKLESLYSFLGEDFNRSCFVHFMPVDTIHGKFIRLPCTSSVKIMQIIGYFIGDGHAGSKSLRFKDTNKNNLENYHHLIENEFNVRGRIAEMKDTKAMLLECNSVYLCKWLRVNFVNDKYSFISKVGQLPLSELSAFIKGLFDAEGCVGTKSRQLSMSMNDEFIVRSLQLWLLRFGIISSVAVIKENRKQKRTNPSYKLIISNKKSLELFLKNISFGDQVKGKKLKKIIKKIGDKYFSFKTPPQFQEIILSRVLSIEKISSNIDHVYDLEVENNENFLANGVFTHNSRWATHGKPNEKNAHPHLDCRGQIAIVHNGIIENYTGLKEILKKEGHKFVSETDSEVIAHLIEKFLDNNLEKAVAKSLKLIEGAYALAVLDKKSNQIIAARKSSPLVLGIGRGETFIASDSSAILGKAKKVIYLDDGEVAVISNKGYKIKKLNGKTVDKKVHKLNMKISQIEKKGFKHFMLKEIFEQPQALENTLRGRIKDGKLKLNISGNLKSVKRIIITACGTSYYSALIGKYLIEKFAGLPVEVDYSSEFRYRDPIVRKDDLVVVVSQSGETADTLAALKEAKQKGAKTLGIINVVGSTIAREVDSGIYLHAGPEIGVASTKAFTCQVTALILLALKLSQNNFDLAKLSQKKEVKKVLTELEKLPQKIKEDLKEAEKIKKIAKKFKNSNNFLYLGRNLNFPVALEGALKLKEISYIHAEGYPAAEMKHGPIALVDKNMPVVFICPKDNTYHKILSNMEEVKARGGNIIAIVNHSDPKIKKLAKYVIKVPGSIEELSPIINTIPLQLLAYYIADLKGINVDKPRNLAKSVTVE